MARARAPPAERVRERLRDVAGDAVADAMPAGYQRLGRVLLLRLPEPLGRYGPLLGEAWREELGVATVLAHRGPIGGELRTPSVVRLAGDSAETEVVEHGSRWRLDAARIMFAAGNRTERLRFARLVRPGERVGDLFAGIGYFTVPAARSERRATFVAVEKNPVAFAYLEENLRRNGVDDRVRAWLGDNRDAPLEPRAFDRIVLGYLPSSLPWIGRGLDLLAPDGGELHVHLIADARDGLSWAEQAVKAEVGRAGGTPIRPARAREVKPYGPGRIHAVVDAAVRPGG
jgi:tRNA wybutosine-synthesizing protein 2